MFDICEAQTILLNEGEEALDAYLDRFFPDDGDEDIPDLEAIGAE